MLDLLGIVHMLFLILADLYIKIFDVTISILRIFLPEAATALMANSLILTDALEHITVSKCSIKPGKYGSKS